jgi:AcrR family transcriptional regulator
MDSVNKSAHAVDTDRASRRDPEKSREKLLLAALREFSDKGIGGARVDEIARQAGVNKRMIYHYFGNKDDLFLAALERAYEEIRSAEQELHLEDLPPADAMRRLVSFTFNYFIEAPHFISLLNTENLHRAAHLKKSRRIQDMHSTVVGMLRDLLQRGSRAGVFRGDADPVQLFITIASVGYFYFSNIHTLSTIFDRDFASASERMQRHDHAIDVVLGYLRP